ncbi:MAG TPA: hypothetical protein VL522_18685 [Bordetella sp.]|jgi:hypothetical protein|nr:hypothetical protein [Bordetella sp.]
MKQPLRSSVEGALPNLLAVPALSCRRVYAGGGKLRPKQNPGSETGAIK